MLARSRTAMASLGGSLDQHQLASSRMAANILSISKDLHLRCRFQEDFRASLPLASGNADHVFAADASDPLPMMLGDQVEPGRVKVGIGDNDRQTTDGQKLRQTGQKSAMYRLVSIQSLRMNSSYNVTLRPSTATLARNRCQRWSVVASDQSTNTSTSSIPHSASAPLLSDKCPPSRRAGPNSPADGRRV